MKQITRFIPNTLTLGNLFCGCGAIIFALRGQQELVFWAIIAAAAFDFLDGFAARLLKAYSPIGGDLDSLSDMVSFGVAPSMAAYMMLAPLGDWAFVAFLLAAGSALRLAKFNVDTRQTTEFRGLPTPAMALFFVSFQFFAPYVQMWHIVGFVVLFTAAMVCDIPMIAFKFKDFSLKNNLVKYVFILFSVVMIAVTQIYLSPASIIIAYILLSFVLYIVGRGKKS